MGLVPALADTAVETVEEVRGVEKEVVKAAVMEAAATEAVAMEVVKEAVTAVGAREVAMDQA